MRKGSLNPQMGEYRLRDVVLGGGGGAGGADSGAAGPAVVAGSRRALQLQLRHGAQ